MTADYSDALQGIEDQSSVAMTISFDGVPQKDLVEVSPKEVYLGESLLTPGLQTSITFDSYLHSVPTKWFDNFKNADVLINIEKPGINDFRNLNLPTSMNVLQKVYRLDNRYMINNNTERFTLRACDQTQLTDPKTLVSRSFKCTTPSEVVDYVLSVCAGSTSNFIETSSYPRDYIAENIHPFQVVSQQANYAVAEETDPSFLHYMTYGDGFDTRPAHHFRSLRGLSRQNPVMQYYFNEVSNTFSDPCSILRYKFPCDFDLLTDILNGIDENGNNINSLILFDPINKSFSLFNQDFNLFGCGIGSGVMKMAISNQNTYQQQDMCPDYAKEYLRFRQARMGLLAQDKIALRMTVPFNPVLHAGKTIDVNLYNKETRPEFEFNYGSGRYMILHMFHHIVSGGLATTTIDCVSSTVGRGIV
jgi:hypothetical protein